MAHTVLGLVVWVFGILAAGSFTIGVGFGIYLIFVDRSAYAGAVWMLSSLPAAGFGAIAVAAALLRAFLSGKAYGE